jgi:hypothetical protein
MGTKWIDAVLDEAYAKAIPPGLSVVMIQVPLVVNVDGSQVSVHIGPSEVVKAVIDMAIHAEIARRRGEQ